MVALSAHPNPPFRVALVGYGLGGATFPPRVCSTPSTTWFPTPRVEAGLNVVVDKPLAATAAEAAVDGIPTEHGAYENYYAGIEQALRTHGAPPVDPADAVESLAVIAAAKLSARERRVVRRDELG